jgi:hypothetical protein
MAGKDKLTPAQVKDLFAQSRKKREDVIAQIKADFTKTGFEGVQITNTDLLERYAKRMRLCYHRGLICEVPPPATRAKMEIGDSQILILSAGELYVIDTEKFNDSNKNH